MDFHLGRKSIARWAEQPAEADTDFKLAQEKLLVEMPIGSGGMAEVFSDGQNGMLTPTRDPYAMADAVEKLARDPERAERMGTAGWAFVRKHHRIEDQVEAFRAMFQEVAARSGS